MVNAERVFPTIQRCCRDRMALSKHFFRDVRHEFTLEDHFDQVNISRFYRRGKRLNQGRKTYIQD